MNDFLKSEAVAEWYDIWGTAVVIKTLCVEHGKSGSSVTPAYVDVYGVVHDRIRVSLSR